jgi:hypothetical protein
VLFHCVSGLFSSDTGLFNSVNSVIGLFFSTVANIGLLKSTEIRDR